MGLTPSVARIVHRKGRKQPSKQSVIEPLKGYRLGPAQHLRTWQHPQKGTEILWEPVKGRCVFIYIVFPFCLSRGLDGITENDTSGKGTAKGRE